MPARLCAHSDQPGRTSGRTRDDCQRLDEEDGEEDVPGDRRGGNRCDGPPGIARNQRRHGSWYNDACTENGAGNDADEGRRRLVRLLTLRGGAAGVGLCLGHDATWAGALRFAPVHRAGVAVRAAGYTGFRRCHPTGAQGDTAGDKGHHGRQSGHTPQPPDHGSKDAAFATNCQTVRDGRRKSALPAAA